MASCRLTHPLDEQLTRQGVVVVGIVVAAASSSPLVVGTAVVRRCGGVPVMGGRVMVPVRGTLRISTIGITRLLLLLLPRQSTNQPTNDRTEAKAKER